MCGISGIISSSKQGVQIEDCLKKMVSSISHRGPDDTGLLVKDNVGLGFVRLSIIDLAHGHQPIANEDETIFIIFNGEIYNFQELRGPLQAKGHIFTTNTDTEVILHLYEEYGTDCLKHLRGMFAFCIYDLRTKELFCARDRFGIKPFYYYSDSDSFIFASEIKAITAHNFVDRELNVAAMDSFLAYGYTVGVDTIYDRIKKLRPGHYMKLHVDRPSLMEIKQYWEATFEPDESEGEAYWREQVVNGFEDTVRAHMVSDLPVGAFLSGGIDSGSIVAMMTKFTNQRVKTFSIGFAEKEYNELDNARFVAHKYNTDHHELIVEQQSLDLLSKIVDAYDEPFGDSSAIPTYLVSQFASNYVKVVLSGDGGDELFGGYKHYTKLLSLARYSSITKLPGQLLAAGKRLTKHKQYTNKSLYYLSNDIRYMNALIGVFSVPERIRMYRKEHLGRISPAFAENYKHRQMRVSTQTDHLSLIQENDIANYLVDDILVKADIASMQNSIELRVPFLDHIFAETAFKVPSSLKIKDGNTKYIFKKALEPLLPPEILNLPKKGFEIPLKKWFRHDLKSFTHDTLLAADAPLLDYFNRDAIINILKASETNNRDTTNKIWCLIILNLWLQKNKA